MSLTTPTTQDIADNIVSQTETAISQTVPLLPKAFIRVLAKALAGVFILVYKYAGFMFLQWFVGTATFAPTTVNGRVIRPLVEWGRLVGEGDPVAATQAELLIDITVTNQTGTLPSGSQLLNSQTGVTYITIGAVALSAATVQATVRAVADQQGGSGAGAIGNMTAGQTLDFANPLPNVARTAVVASATVTGSDAETENAYRERVLGRFQRRPQGGAYADYRTWGLEVAGIIGIYPYTGDPGEVDVYVEATVASSGSADGIPTSPQLDAVADAIELDVSGLASRRPANAFVNVLPITRTAFDVEITGLTDAGLQTTIEDAIDEYLRGRAPFIAGLSVLPRIDRVAQTALAGIVDQIVSAEGASFTGLTVEESGSPVVVYTLGEGELAKAGTVTFV